MSSDVVSWIRKRHGPALRAWRLALELSQAEVAELAEVHQTSVSGWERGDIAPRSTPLRRLADRAGYRSALELMEALDDLAGILDPPLTELG